ncbi:MAG: DUF4254 domain-containing protein [Pseudomonadota bacterium]
MLIDLDALSIVQLHDVTLARKGWPDDSSEPVMPGAWCWIHANHRYNSLLWNEEDKARRTDVGAAEIANSKRLIDRHNQRRNDAVEALDEAILAQLPDVETAANARLSSETAGAMIDRLSILALKIFHMREQTRRADADAAHIEACAAKLKRLQTQRHDLACCLDQLLRDARLGRAYFKVYRQFKMYNDPTLNPYLYADNALAEADKAAP